MGSSDAQLLTRFAESREEEAFAALVQRHGPMVLGVCRRVLSNAQEAEDVFQATFLVLARRAGSIRDRAAVAGWLHGVAARLAAKLRCQASQRRFQEQQFKLTHFPKPGADLLSFVIWQEMRPVLDEELGRLPEKYRSPLVLCYLEGKTHDEAAVELGWPKGSMSRRMEKARDLLRQRLAERGITLSAGVIFGVLAGHNAATALTEPLAQQTLQASLSFVCNSLPAAGAISPSVLILAQGALHTMSALSIGKFAAGSLLLLTLLGGTTGMLAFSAHGQTPSTDPGSSTIASQTPESERKPPLRATSTRRGPVSTSTTPARPMTGDGGTGPMVRPDLDPTGQPKHRMRNHREVHQMLDQPTNYFERGYKNNEPLYSVLGKIEDDFNVTIRFSKEALLQLKNNNIDNLHEREVSLRGIKQMSLRQALREVLANIDTDPPLTVVVKGGHIVVQPQLTEGELSTDDPQNPAVPLRELISISVEKKALREVLRELAENTGANIVLDGRLTEVADKPVTISLQNVPLITAVTLLTDMAELRVVPMDNVLYVTTEENAVRLQHERAGSKPPTIQMPLGGNRPAEKSANPK